MNVVWKYLDKRAGAVAALKDFGSMKFIIENTDDEIKAAYEKMSSVSAVQNEHTLQIGIASQGVAQRLLQI